MRYAHIMPQAPPRPSKHAHMVQIMKMASYQEVATKDVRKRLCRLLKAETKPLIVDLLRIEWGAGA